MIWSIYVKTKKCSMLADRRASIHKRMSILKTNRKLNLNTFYKIQYENSKCHPGLYE